MYLQEIQKCPLTTTLVKIKYDCCGKEHILKWKDADKNFKKNNGKHICRPCWLKSNNPAKDEKTKEKIKKTNLERYGATTALNSPENLEKRKELFNDHEFVKNRSEKHKQTCIEKYGVKHHMLTDELKEKIKNTNLEKYGTEYPLQNPEILAKVQATNLERYGDVCSLNDPEVKAKALKSLFKHYGVEYYNQLPEMKEYLRKNCREWLKESWANPWAKGITRPEEWNKKQRETVSKKIIEGNWAGGFKSNTRGYFPAWKCKREMPRFLSSLELIFHFFLNVNPLVEWYAYQPFAIPYKKQDGSNHLYHPDYQVKYFNEDILHIFETKTYKDKDSVDVWLKHDAAVEYASLNNMTYTILFDDDVEKLGINLEKVKELPGIKFDPKE
jgi:hypothetical protein